MAENQNTNGEISQVNNTVQPINGAAQTPMAAQINTSQTNVQSNEPTVESKEKKPRYSALCNRRTPCYIRSNRFSRNRGSFWSLLRNIQRR